MSEEKNNVTNIGEAISVLVQGVNIAQAKGIYTFGDSAKIASALDFIDGAQAAANSKMEDGPASPVTSIPFEDKPVEVKK